MSNKSAAAMISRFSFVLAITLNTLTELTRLKVLRPAGLRSAFDRQLDLHGAVHFSRNFKS
jgi:hypothetical protein